MAYDILKENVPSFKRRQGDVVLSGPNNSTIVLGRDRRDKRDTGYGDRPGSGAALVVVGRQGEDPSIREDRATIYLSARSDPDEMLGDSFGGSRRDVSSAVIRADSVRISARKDIKLTAGGSTILIKEDGTVVINSSGKVMLGKDGLTPIDGVVKGDAIEPFTGMTYFALGSSSSKVLSG